MRSLKELLKFKVHAEDDLFGEISDFYFDDHDWNIRYFVVDTGGWLSGRKVLISPSAAGVPDWLEESIPISLNRVQIENSPPISADRPVSRQHEEAISLYYGWPRYWSAAGIPMPGLGGLPNNGPGLPLEKMTREGVHIEENREDRLQHNPNLQSMIEVMGYSIAATNGEIGHVEDFLADMDTWQILKLVVNTRNWLPGKHVVIDLRDISEVSWENRRVSVSLSRENVAHSPELGKGSAFV